MKSLNWSLATPRERSFYYSAVFGFIGLFEGFLEAGTLCLGGLLLAGKGPIAAGIISGIWGLAALGPGSGRASAPTCSSARGTWRLAALGCLLAAAVPALAQAESPFILAPLFAAAGLGAASRGRARRALLAASGASFGEALHRVMSGAGTAAGALLLGAILLLRRGAAPLQAAFSFLWFPAALVAAGFFLARRIWEKGLEETGREEDATAQPRVEAPGRLWGARASAFLFALGLMNPMLVASAIEDGGWIPSWGTATGFAAAFLAAILTARLAAGRFRGSRLPEALLPALAACVPLVLFRGQTLAGIFALLLWGAVTGLGRASAGTPDREDGRLPPMASGISFLLGGSCIGFALSFSSEAAIRFVAAAEVLSLAFLAIGREKNGRHQV